MKDRQSIIKNQEGMAATEYIVGLLLIAIASVGVFSVFGSQIKTKVAHITAALNSSADTDATLTDLITTGATTAGEAVTRSQVETSMSGDDTGGFSTATQTPATP